MASINSTITNDECYNETVGKFTCLRYFVLFCYVLYKVHTKQRNVVNVDDIECIEKSSGYFWGFIDFGFREGVGIGVYFVTSAIMDNIAIWLPDIFSFETGNVEFCKSTIQTSVYSMALISFIPNAIIGHCFQHEYYYDAMTHINVLFVGCMVSTTMFCFMIRMYVIYTLGWIHFIDSCLQSCIIQITIFIACITPPLVDLIQATLLTIKEDKHNGKLLSDCENPE